MVMLSQPGSCLQEEASPLLLKNDSKSLVVKVFSLSAISSSFSHIHSYLCIRSPTQTSSITTIINPAGFPPQFRIFNSLPQVPVDVIVIALLRKKDNVLRCISALGHPRQAFAALLPFDRLEKYTQLYKHLDSPHFFSLCISLSLCLKKIKITHPAISESVFNSNAFLITSYAYQKFYFPSLCLEPRTLLSACSVFRQH